MSSKFGRAGGAGRGSAALRHGMKETGPPPLGRGMGMGALQLRVQSLGAGAVGMRGAAGMKNERGMAKGSSRLGGRDLSSSSAGSQEEKFQLLQHQQFQEGASVRPFAMAIRLTPELLSDLKRAEAEGSACVMKFGVTPSGHVGTTIQFLAFLGN